MLLSLCEQTHALNPIKFVFAHAYIDYFRIMHFIKLSCTYISLTLKHFSQTIKWCTWGNGHSLKKTITKSPKCYTAPGNSYNIKIIIDCRSELKTSVIWLAFILRRISVIMCLYVSVLHNVVITLLRNITKQFIFCK